MALGRAQPDFMDALMPLASLPTQISGRNRVWRRIVIDAIRHDPDWKNGDYDPAARPAHRAADAALHERQSADQPGEGPTLAKRDRSGLRESPTLKTHDANDVLYAVEASRDYDPGPALETIHAPLLAINSADDLINPPELGILEREIRRVPKGRAIVIPLSQRPAATAPTRWRRCGSVTLKSY